MYNIMYIALQTLGISNRQNGWSSEDHDDAPVIKNKLPIDIESLIQIGYS